MTDANANEQEFLQMGIDAAQYEALEREFKEVLETMVGERSMQRFQNEYEKLYRALKTSYESEKRLVKRCKELNETIVGNATRVKAAMRLTTEDSQTISLLKREVDRAWQLVELAKDKEDKAKRIIQDLRAEITHLHKIVEEGTGLSFSHDNNVQKLLTEKEQFKTQLQNKMEQVSDLENTKNELLDKVNSLQLSVITKDKELQEKTQEVDELNTVKKQLERQKEDELSKAKNFEARKKELEVIVEQLTSQKLSLDNDRNNISEQLKDKMNENKKQEIKIQEQVRYVEAFRKDLEKVGGEKDKLFAIKYDQDKEIKNLKVSADKQEKEMGKLDKVIKRLMNENTRILQEKNDAIQEKEQAKSYMNSLMRDFDWIKKRTDEEQANIMKLERDRNMLKTNLTNLEEKHSKNKSMLARKEQLINTLTESLNNNKEQLQKLIKQIKKLQAEKEEKVNAANKANANLMQMVEELKLKRNTIGELKKEAIEFENKLKQQQNLYEVVRSDRNLYGKNLVEANDEVIELRKKFKIAQHSIQQLKDEIEAKEAALLSEHNELGTKTKELEVTEKKLKAEEAKLALTKDQLLERETTISKLSVLIQRAVEDHQAEKKAHQTAISERDILGTQLIRRNDELALLYEKIKILQMTLGRGEVQYAERLEDIKLLKYKISELKCELKIEKGKAAEIVKYKAEVCRLATELQKERLQVKALSEELENPLNYHRWRRIKGTDPDTYELIQKIQTLQKRLIKKTEEVVEKDVMIQEKEKLYVELKNLLARQPGPEVAEQLSIYQQNLKEKTNQMKAMAAELNMYQAQVNEYKYEIERLTRELQEMKRKYYEQKRREAMQREAQNRMETKQIHQNTGPQQRFTGGGFPLAL